MMKSKRLLSLLLAIIFCLSLLPFGVFADKADSEAVSVEDNAEESSVTTPEEITEEDSAEIEDNAETDSPAEAETIAEEIADNMVEDGSIVASGYCGAEGDGSNLTWVLDDGTLTISVNGKMKDYYFDETSGEKLDDCYYHYYTTRERDNEANLSPWFSYITEIYSIVIQNGVTSIGDGAFYWCAKPINISLPNSITGIGNGAFFGCTKLSTMTVPNNVVSIGDRAFKRCSGLKSLIIGTKVTSIGYEAFSECSLLDSVTIPDSVINIGSYAFSDCAALKGAIIIPDSVSNIGECPFLRCPKLTAINVNEDNAFFCSDEGVLFNKDKTILIAYPMGKNGNTYDVPNSVITIGSTAFYQCRNLVSITIPDSVTSIEDFAFYRCTALTNIEIPKSVTSVGAYAFCSCTNLTSIRIPNGITQISASTFYLCNHLSSIHIPFSVRNIDMDAFGRCSALTDIYYFGNESTWKEILKGKNNDALYTANKHYERTPEIHFVAYNANGGTDSPEAQEKIYGTALTLSTTEPIYSGHKFTGWATSSDSKIVQYKAGENYNAEEDVTLYAVWVPSFSDVQAGSYYEDSVSWAVENNVTAGTGNGKFSPDGQCSRAQIITFLWRANGCPEPTSSANPFTDVKSSQYYYKAVLWAVEKGITSGTSKTTFSPNATCTRGQVVTFLWRANGKPTPTSTTNPFTDVKSTDYFYTAVLWAVENGITSGTSKTAFSPNKTCNRAQAVTFLYRTYH